MAAWLAVGSSEEGRASCLPQHTLEMKAPLLASLLALASLPPTDSLRSMAAAAPLTSASGAPVANPLDHLLFEVSGLAGGRNQHAVHLHLSLVHACMLAWQHAFVSLASNEAQRQRECIKRGTRGEGRE